MSDLRNKVIKLAYNNPELRDDLLPLVKTSEVRVTEDYVRNFFDRWPGGFSHWARDAREETLSELKIRGYKSLASEIAISIRDDIRSKNKEAPSLSKIIPVVMRWIDDYREELIQELE